MSFHHSHSSTLILGPASLDELYSLHGSLVPFLQADQPFHYSFDNYFGRFSVGEGIKKGNSERK